MATRTPSAAQIAARKTFADLARSGAFTKNRKPAAKKKAAPKRRANPVKKPPLAHTVGKHIAKLVNEGYPFKQAEAIAIHEYGIHSKPATVKAAQKVARDVLNYPDPLRVTKKGVVRRNPIGRNNQSDPANIQWAMRGKPAAKRAKKNPSMPAHRAPSAYAVHKALKSGEPGALLGKFPTLAAAKEYAQAYATAHKCAVGIVGKS